MHHNRVYPLWLVVVAALLSLMCGQAQAHASALYIVVAEQNALASISSSSLKKIYKLKQESWFDHSNIYPVNMAKDHVLRDMFSSQVLHKSTAQMEIYYLKMALIGRGQPPHVVKSYDEMIAYVRKHPGAIGYVDKPMTISGIKIIPIQ